MDDPNTTTQGALLGLPGLIFIGFYVASLLFVGWLGLRAKKENTLSDFYLGGRNLSFIVLLLTFFATQYSGNTLMGYPGKAYRTGFHFLFVLAAMVTVTAVLFIYAPRLRKLSEKRGYITPGDFLQDRFGSRRLTVFATMLWVFALINYLVTNLMVLGYLAEAVTGGLIGFGAAVAVLAVVMIAYEAMGGMRSVAWTDVTQGIILFIGVIVLFTAALIFYGGPASVSEALELNRPEIWRPPAGREWAAWLGMLLLLGMGNALYPHTIQRIYAARAVSALRRSLKVMVFMPIFISLLMALLGFIAAARFPGLETTESDQVVLLLLGDLSASIPWMQVIVVVFIAAIIAATMSTIDSALLSISSLVTEDLYHPIRPEVSQRHLTFFGKGATVVLMTLAVILTMSLKDKTIFRIIVFKHELLVQVAPALMLGLHWDRLAALPVLSGMLAGTVAAVVITLEVFGPDQPLGLHAGLWGLAINLSVIFSLQGLRGRKFSH